MLRRRRRKGGTDAGTRGGEARSFRCGTPSAEEWDDLWKSAPTDPDVDNEEYEAVCEKFHRRLARIGEYGFGDGCDFYFRGDNPGDRTQYLELVNPDALTIDLIGRLQDWLKEPRFRKWRVVIITYVSKGATPMVYPDVVRLGREYDGVELAAALADIVARMKRGERV